MLRQKVVRFSHIGHVFQATFREIEEEFIFDQNIVEIFSEELKEARQAFKEEILKHVNGNIKILEIGTTPLSKNSEFYSWNYLNSLQSTREVFFNELEKPIYELIIVDLNEYQPSEQFVVERILQSAFMLRCIYFLHEGSRPIILPKLGTTETSLHAMVNVIDSLSICGKETYYMELIYQKQLYWLMV